MPDGTVWDIAQRRGKLGRLDPAADALRRYDASQGPGRHGITTAPDGSVSVAPLAGSDIAHVDLDTGAAAVIGPPTPRRDGRRVWADVPGRTWVREWNVGQVACTIRAPAPAGVAPTG